MRLLRLFLLLQGLHPGSTFFSRYTLSFQALPPRAPALRHPPPAHGRAAVVAMQLREGSDAALRTPTVAFEGDMTLPKSLMSSGWFEQQKAAGITFNKEPGKGTERVGQADTDFDALCLKLDGVLLFEAQREKSYLDARLGALELGHGANAEDARTFTDNVDTTVGE